MTSIAVAPSRATARKASSTMSSSDGWGMKTRPSSLRSMLVAWSASSAGARIEKNTRCKALIASIAVP